MVIKSIIFDWGGVIVYNFYNKFTESIYELAGRDPIEIMMKFTDLATDYETNKMSSEEFWHTLRKDLNIKLEIGKIIEVAKKSLVLNYEVFEIVTELRLKYKLAILSNNINELSEYIKKKFVLDPFEIRIFSNEVRLRKPDPKIYQLVLDNLRLNPDQCVFVDDMKENVDVAQRLGIHGILFHDSLQLKDELRKIGVKI